jgi:hypothetical protein
MFQKKTLFFFFFFFFFSFSLLLKQMELCSIAKKKYYTKCPTGIAKNKYNTKCPRGSILNLERFQGVIELTIK